MHSRNQEVSTRRRIFFQRMLKNFRVPFERQTENLKMKTLSCLFVFDDILTNSDSSCLFVFYWSKSNWMVNFSTRKWLAFPANISSFLFSVVLKLRNLHLSLQISSQFDLIGQFGANNFSPDVIDFTPLFDPIKRFWMTMTNDIALPVFGQYEGPRSIPDTTEPFKNFYSISNYF